MDNTQENQGNPMLPGILQLLSTIHRRLKQDGQTAVCEKKACIGNWEWGDKEQQAFDELRTKLTRAPVPVYFDPLALTKIETDASKYVSSG